MNDKMEMAFKFLNSDTPIEYFGLGVAILALAEEQKRTADALEIIADHSRLEAQDRALREIRDLARIGPPPVGEYAGRWDVHMLNKIADMAAQAIEEGK